MKHFADRLLAAVEAKGSPCCVGFDPVIGKLPDEIRTGASDELAAFEAFAEKTFPIFAQRVPCLKIQSACFERYGWAGVRLYESLADRARAMGLIVIGDVKRGDIGTTADHYARATLAHADAVTVNAYFGLDGLLPFLDLAAGEGKGVFALVRTSNPGGDAIQSLKLDDGRSVGEAMGSLVAEIGDQERYRGESGLSLLGAVVGATKRGDAAILRKVMPRQIFLVPGFGAQGGSPDDIRSCFLPDGSGALITASRSVTYPEGAGNGHRWLSDIEGATESFISQVLCVVND